MSNVGLIRKDEDATGKMQTFACIGLSELQLNANCQEDEYLHNSGILFL